jgi:prepilin-type processing-associated H-X9-DG protein
MTLHALNAFLSGTFTWVLRTTWQASLLAVLVVTAQWLLGKRLTARTRYWLWGVVVLRLVLPPLPETRWTLFPNRAQQQTAIATAVTETKPLAVTAVLNTAPPTERPAVAIDPQQVAALKKELAAMSPPELGVNEMEPAPAVNPAAISQSQVAYSQAAIGRRWVRPGLLAVLLYLWLAGVAVKVIGLLIGSWKLARAVRACSRWNDASIDAIAMACAAESGLNAPPPMLVADHLSGPAVTGLFAPKLLLPREVVAAFSHDELRMMLLHEFAHLRRGDLQASWLLSFLQAVHWFNPVLHRAMNHVRADCELACDEFVLKAAAPDSTHRMEQTYGHALLHLAERLVRQPSSSLQGSAMASIGMLHNPRNLHRRIMMIAQFNRASGTFSGRWPVAFAGGLLLSAGVLLADAGDPSKPKPPERPDEGRGTRLGVVAGGAADRAIPGQRTESGGEAALGLRLDKFAVVGDRGGASEEMRREALKAELQMANKKLEMLAQQLGADDPQVASMRKRVDEMTQRLDALNFEMNSRPSQLPPQLTTLASGDTPESLDVSTAKLRVQSAEVNLRAKHAEVQRSKALQETGVASPGEFAKLQAEYELSQLALQKEELDLRRAELQRAQADAGRRPSFAPFGQPKAEMPPSFKPASSAGVMTEIQDAGMQKIDTATLEKLRKPQVASFDQVLLRDAISAITEQAGVDLLFDDETINDPRIPSDARVRLKVTQPTSGEQLIRWVLRGTQLGYTIDHGVVMIASRAKVEAMTTTRVYDVGSLADNSGMLPQLMQEVVAPNSWQPRGGVGLVRSYGNKLLVTQTAANHSEVEKLLMLLAAKSQGAAIAPPPPSFQGGGGPNPLNLLTAPFEQARAKASLMESASHMKQILIAIHMYASDHDGKLPHNLREELKPYLDGQADAMFLNPRVPQVKDGYTYIRAAERLADLKDPSTTVILYENIDARDSGINAGYADGHVAKAKNGDELLEQIKAMRGALPR